MPRVRDGLGVQRKTVRRAQGVRARKEWAAFHERALAPLTYGQIRQIVSTDEDPHAAITKADASTMAEAWSTWHNALCVVMRYGAPKNIPTPPPEPKGMWDKARENGAADVLLILAYARERR